MNKFKHSLEIEGFGRIVNFKTDLLSASFGSQQTSEKILNVVRAADKYSPLFWQFVASGENFPKASLRAERRDKGNLRLLVVYSLSKVYIEDYRMHNDEEYFSLRFENVERGVSSMP